MATDRILDTTTPSVARSYDAMLGGKDNYPVDRDMADAVTALWPGAPVAAQENRRWLVRVVRWLADMAGMDQFLDCGSGLPTQENTHDVAQRVNPEATVLYVDNDPACQVHGRALLEENERTHFVDADLTEPERLFAHPAVARHLDLNRPLVLMQVSTIHHVSDAQDPADIMRRYIDLLPSGSYVALTHFWDPDDGGELTRLARELEVTLEKLGSGWWRTHEQVRRFFEGLEMVEPGLVPVEEWWPTGPRLTELSEVDRMLLGGVGRKP